MLPRSPFPALRRWSRRGDCLGDDLGIIQIFPTDTPQRCVHPGDHPRRHHAEAAPTATAPAAHSRRKVMLDERKHLPCVARPLDFPRILWRDGHRSGDRIPKTREVRMLRHEPPEKLAPSGSCARPGQPRKTNTSTRSASAPTASASSASASLRRTHARSTWNNARKALASTTRASVGTGPPSDQRSTNRTTRTVPQPSRCRRARIRVPSSGSTALRGSGVPCIGSRIPRGPNGTTTRGAGGQRRAPGRCPGTRREASQWARSRASPFRLQERANREEVAHDSVGRVLEDRSLRIRVDRHDHARRAHAREVLDGAESPSPRTRMG